MKIVMGKKLYSVNETAELLGVTNVTIHNYSRTGLKVTQIGGRKYFTEEAISAFLKNET